MLPLQSSKVLNTCPSVAIKDNASWTTVEIDTLGFDYATVFWALGATDIAMAALKMQESDTAGSGQTDITGLVWGTSTNIAGSTSTLPSSTNDNGVFRFDIDLRGRKRYLTLVATAGDGAAGTYGSALTLLHRAEDGPTTAAQCGCVEILRV